ncbi:MAG: hypothetical protein CND43_01910 [Flavobacteriales bacterium MED-G15]|nr:MAG: hypothetical protein CND43_01910 [Flavobacteriales bacterium MED-G15]
MEINLCVRILPYFYFMFEWIDKLKTNQDWVTFLFLLIFFFVVFLFKRNSKQFSHFLKFWKVGSYLKIYSKDKFISPFYYFNLILLVITFISYSLLGYFFYESIWIKSFGKVPIIYFFSSLIGVTGLRFLLMKIIFNYTEDTAIFQQTVFKSLSIHGLISFLVLLLFIINHYRLEKGADYFITVTTISSVLVVITHALIYFKIAFKKPHYSVYLILYLCGLKIAPWLWLYGMIF